MVDRLGRSSTTSPCIDIIPASSFSSTYLSSSAEPTRFPRAAVAVVVRWCDGGSSSTVAASTTSTPQWLLIQRGNEPNKGMWSLPGGKIEYGEGTLVAAKRELSEETGLETRQNENSNGTASMKYDLKWHSNGPFACSDSIHHAKGSSNGFHYVISQCFAEVVASSIPNIIASDDAMDARWWSADKVKKGEDDGIVTHGVLKVLERSELLYTKGLLQCN
ncbi:hypothetical protein ACHAXR_009670 [Thalassiosira sp. AJA248-18]